MYDLKTYLKNKREQINKALDKLLPDSQDSRLISAMKYSLMAGGKRLRPILCLAASEAVGGQADEALPAACVLEFIHTYSLIHDDLPAMDNDDLRRGKPTCHKAFDESTAILAGDGLLTLAFEILSSSEFVNEKNAVKQLKVIYEISRAAGCCGMIEGQMRDISSENLSLSIKDLEKMHTLKTGALIEASVTCGALMGNGTKTDINSLKIYAKNIGLAFQVTDDILNIEGDPCIMGKAAGTDESRRKSTYPSIMGIDSSKEFAEKLVDNSLKALKNFDKKSDPLRAVSLYILNRKR
ncbi:Polyprenyl synthetase [Desulfonema limicola]|uniref:Polyprenyl synthetase n=1 Tax=Desulfonema limicola TaxID=45656 RepID=A0A975B3H8_9BACT|nr:farnesyl diphosphate synthase [Desulfonema limicola]QTA78096.1 Polyprenyl synthetase [Desulfonema limicola]